MLDFKGYLMKIFKVKVLGLIVNFWYLKFFFFSFLLIEGKGWILLKLNINFWSNKLICRGVFCFCGFEGSGGDENWVKFYVGRYRRICWWRLK